MINKVYNEDCLQGMKRIADNSVDSIVTDPPYGLSFMGKKWDYNVPKVEVWKEALRILKPGGYALVACGTRTQHRMAVNLEDAGFEIRDIVAWVYGSGFPKSLNISKSIENKITTGNASKNGFHKLKGKRRSGRIGMYDTVEEQGFRKVNPDQLGAFDLEAQTDEAKKYEGWGTALKPAMELFTLCRKPLSEKTVAENVIKWGTGGINIDGCRVGSDNITTQGGDKFKGEGIYNKYNTCKKTEHIGRFPANLIHDGSEDVTKHFPNTKSKASMRGVGLTGKTEKIYGKGNPDFNTLRGHNDSGSASRFFYCAKASKAERGESNNHPTVKPIALMEYLCKLITPIDGIALDPFMGSGTTAIACININRKYIGFEIDKGYYDIIMKRIEDKQKKSQERLF